MIDDKKIEEAAKHYAEENSMSIEDQMGDMYDGIEELSDAYKSGANWAINEFLKYLWHSIEEEPDKRKSDIITIGSYNYISIHLKESFIWKEESCRYSISRCQITKWAYLSDILPKQKGGNHD